MDYRQDFMQTEYLRNIIVMLCVAVSWVAMSVDAQDRMDHLTDERIEQVLTASDAELKAVAPPHAPAPRGH